MSEFNPHQFFEISIKELKKNRNCRSINKAISSKKETVEFIDVTSGYTQMSGLNKDFYKECSKNAKDNYTKNFSENIYINNMKKIIDEVINEKN